MKESHGIRHVLLSSVLFLSWWPIANGVGRMSQQHYPGSAPSELPVQGNLELLASISHPNHLDAGFCMSILSSSVAHKQPSASPGSLKVTQSLQDSGPLFLQEQLFFSASTKLS